MPIRPSARPGRPSVAPSKAKETLGGTLVTIHNVFFMNRLMRDIREGIAADTLDEVERKYVHPTLKASVRGGEGGEGLSDGIGS